MNVHYDVPASPDVESPLLAGVFFLDPCLRAPGRGVPGFRGGLRPVVAVVSW